MTVGQVEFERIREDRIGRSVGAEQALLLGVSLHQRDQVGRAIGKAEVLESLLVHREEAHGGAVLGGHIGDGGAVGERERADAGTVVFDKLAHHALLAQHLGDGEHQVGGGAALIEAAMEFKTDHRGQQHGDGLAEHAGLGFNAADAPAEHAEAVDHGGVRIGADHGIGIHRAVLVAEDDLCEILQVDLVDDAGVGRDDAEVPEGGLSPAKQHVALAIALEFQDGVEVEGVLAAEVVYLHGVIDHQVRGHQGIGAGGIGAHGGKGVAHGGEIDHTGHAGEVLKQHARGHEGDFLGAGAFAFGDERHVGGGDALAVLVAEEVLEQDADREGKARDVGDALFLERRETEVVVVGRADAQLRRCVERIVGHCLDYKWVEASTCGAALERR